MENMTPEFLLIIVTTIVAGVAIMLGTIDPRPWAQGKVAETAIEGMARQPDRRTPIADSHADFNGAGRNGFDLRVVGCAGDVICQPLNHSLLWGLIHARL